MFPQRFHALTGKKWFVKLAWVMGIIGVTTMISSPVLARRFYGFAFLQPSAYRNYPYRNSNSTIADTLAKDGKYANLVDELKEAGLFDTLKKPGYFTIFAPTDNAFNSLDSNVFKQYSQPENRVKVLKYHMIVGEITPEQIKTGVLKTLEGSELRITEDANGEVKVNEAKVYHPATTTTNGVIVQINGLLIPSDVNF
ncbi:beta-Ig-H3/fasciclin [Fischerella thermalis CCMEE 5273]|uniref:Beta-Ig-H3/fasciclin n=1 Tax=Fischerella thermalis JSC-11 TaxID=741277 RepID=G6G0C7_9CYAN|nr:fasciclin domain-containing protein [Fischerella thermalis]EHC08377.1 beta-Ig-H3/fasciclin [Fischerella thermalis JSC-11]PMB03024.1 beta-Ig-H3/fasciclin [Fischerella thermalis CCMEE 5328]PMB04265.1 beta-Ig-H3/fasciclin [Fischerella thermalis CCMEE 5273]PMB11519.1 beta-Ig-H3/fasciclin [Fischerella thermalis CCMEE 5282]